MILIGALIVFVMYLDMIPYVSNAPTARAVIPTMISIIPGSPSEILYHDTRILVSYNPNMKPYQMVQNLHNTCRV